MTGSLLFYFLSQNSSHPQPPSWLCLIFLKDFLLLYFIYTTGGRIVPRICSGSAVKNSPAMPEPQVRSVGLEDPLEKEMATHWSILAWRIPWTEEPGGLQYIGLQRVRHNWSNLAHKHNPSKTWILERHFSKQMSQWFLLAHAALCTHWSINCSVLVKVVDRHFSVPFSGKNLDTRLFSRSFLELCKLGQGPLLCFVSSFVKWE